MTRRIAVHIGLPKTGTTFLQQVVFRKHSDLAYLGKKGDDEELNKAGAALVRLCSAELDFQKIKGIFQSALSRSEADKPILFSEEDLSRYSFLDPEMMASRLHGVLGDYFPIYVIRNPIDWLQSLYFFRLLTLNQDAIHGPVHWLNKHMMERGLGSDTADLHFGRVASVYRRLSGSGSIKIICYEDLKSDPQGYLRNFSEHIGISPEKSLELVETTPEHKGRDKVRINQNQAEFLWGCSSLNENMDDFKRHLEKTITNLSNLEVEQRIEKIIADLFDSGEQTLAAWNPAINMILRMLDSNDGKAASFEISEELQNKVRNLCRRQIELDESFPKEQCRAYGYLG